MIALFTLLLKICSAIDLVTACDDRLSLASGILICSFSPSRSQILTAANYKVYGLRRSLQILMNAMIIYFTI